MDDRCQAINQSGEPCGAAHYRNGFCRWHDPDLAAERRVWAAKGGRQSSNRARVKKALPDGMKTMQEIQTILSVTLTGVLSGRIEPGVANAMANVARAIRDIAGAAEMEERIAELERQSGRRIG